MAEPGDETTTASFSLAEHFTLANAMIALICLGLLIGLAFAGRTLLEARRVHLQVAQLAEFDHAVADFRQKYIWLPGDLLAVMARRNDLPAGNGTPAHGDGDGKISPCSLGDQWMLGCETALFWAQLTVSGMILSNFSADSQLANDRLDRVRVLTPYLPESPLGGGIYLAVWNSDFSQPSREPRLAYGNYYEISAFEGIRHEKMLDNAYAISPSQSAAVDRKMDDGMPLTGRVVVNGGADWPKESWGSLAKPGNLNCVAPDYAYNTGYFLRANSPLCHLAVRLEQELRDISGRH